MHKDDKSDILTILYAARELSKRLHEASGGAFKLDVVAGEMEEAQIDDAIQLFQQSLQANEK
jgi:hypothetical protein